MASYLHPGVYIEEVPSGVMPIEGVGTSTACFLGYCVQGPIGDPVLISSIDAEIAIAGGKRKGARMAPGFTLG